MPGTPAEKAAKYGVSRATISRWGSGEQAPRDAATLAQIEADGGPLVCEWDEAEAQPATRPPAPPAKPAGEANSTTVQAEANRLLGMVQDATTEAWNEPDVGRRLAMLRDAAAITQQLGRTVGAGHVVTERQILDSPHWKRLSDVITETLEPWPDAMAALAARLLGGDRA
jgi:transcriptional regulator with XRE-family HTH domain